MKKYFIFCLACIFFQSCVSLKVEAPVPFIKNSEVTNIAFFPVMIGKINQPLFPLLDASILNKKTNKIADEIMDLQKDLVTSYRDTLAKFISLTTNTKIIYGEELHNLQGFKVIKESYNFNQSLLIDNNNFPKILMSKNDINPFKYIKGDVNLYFTQPYYFAKTIAQVCEVLDVDAIAVSYSNLTVFGATAFGISASLRLESNLYIVNKLGKIVAHGYVYSKPVGITGGKINDYQSVLMEYPNLFNLMTKKMVQQKSK